MSTVLPIIVEIIKTRGADEILWWVAEGEKMLYGDKVKSPVMTA